MSRDRGKSQQKQRGGETYEPEQIERSYWFPSFCKYIGWTLSTATIVSCAIVITLYAVTFGEVKSMLWLSTVLSSMLLSTFLVQPVKALLLAFFSAYVLQKEEPYEHKPIPEEALDNSFNQERHNNAMEWKAKNAAYYIPPDPVNMRERKFEIKNLTDMRGFLVDLALYILFMTTVYMMIMGSRTDLGIYSNRNMKTLLINADYTNSIPFLRIVNYEQFLEYMNETLLPALLDGKPLEMMLETEPSSGEPIIHRMSDRGYTKDHNFKLLGKPRLRQKRVLPGSCIVHQAVIPTRTNTCRDELTLWNQDTNNYGLAWRPLSDEPKLSPEEAQPWTYKSAWENRAMSYCGRLEDVFTTGGGGYAATLGKTLTNARTILNSLVFFNWFDGRTRSVFVDFTTYSVGANLFNVVILKVEVSATGTFIPSYKIYTQQLVPMRGEVIVMTAVMTIVFTVFIIMLSLREGYKIKRATFKAYFTEGWTLLDMSIVIIGLLIISVAAIRSYHLNMLLQELDTKPGYEFVGFEFAAFWNQLTDYFYASLICLGTIKSFRLMSFWIVFRQWDKVIREIWTILLSLYIIVFIIIIAFAIVFHGLYGSCSERFQTVVSSVTTLFSHMAKNYQELDWSYMTCTSLPATIFYLIFLVFSTGFVMVFFKMVLLVYVEAIRMQPVRSPYHLYPFLKSLIWEDVKIPAPRTPPPAVPLSLVPRTTHDFIKELHLEDVRLQGLKKVTLELLTGKDYVEETALNLTILAILEAGKAYRRSTDFYTAVYQEGFKNVTLVADNKIKEMKKVADKIVQLRNNTLKAGPLNLTSKI